MPTTTQPTTQPTTGQSLSVTSDQNLADGNPSTISQSSAPKMPDAPMTVQASMHKLSEQIQQVRQDTNNTLSKLQVALNEGLANLTGAIAENTIQQARVQANAQIVQGALGIVGGVVSMGVSVYSMTKAGAMQDKETQKLLEQGEHQLNPEGGNFTAQQKELKSRIKTDSKQIQDEQVQLKGLEAKKITSSRGDMADVDREIDQKKKEIGELQSSQDEKQTRLDAWNNANIRAGRTVETQVAAYNSIGHFAKSLCESTGSIIGASLHVAASKIDAQNKIQQFESQQLQSTMQMVTQMMDSTNSALGNIISSFASDSAAQNSARQNIRV